MTTPPDPFDHRAPDERERALIDGNRNEAKAMRARLMAMPPSRERSLALTALEESLMWANKAAFAALVT